MSNVWEDNAALIDDFTVLHATGMPFSEMAAALGHGLTRNACIGKAKRLGLARRGAWPPRDPNNPRRRLPAPRKPKSIYSQPGRPQVRPKPKHSADYLSLVEALPDELPAEAIPLEQRKSFAELRYSHCRYIYGDPTTPDHFFCGGDKYAGSYCAFHHSITHIGTAQLTDFERERRHARYIATARLAAESRRMKACP